MPRSRKSRYSNEYQRLLRLLGEARRATETTQVELARRMGTTQSMLSKLERGVVRLDLIDLLSYLDGIGLDPVIFIRRFRKDRG